MQLLATRFDRNATQKRAGKLARYMNVVKGGRLCLLPLWPAMEAQGKVRTEGAPHETRQQETQQKLSGATIH
jgi:hypothetical protein